MCIVLLLLVIISFHLDLSDSSFLIRYRLSKCLARRVINLLSPFMNTPSTILPFTIERKVSTYKI